MAIYCMEEYFMCLTLLAKEASVLNKITFWKLLSFLLFLFKCCIVELKMKIKKEKKRKSKS